MRNNLKAWALMQLLGETFTLRVACNTDGCVPSTDGKVFFIREPLPIAAVIRIEFDGEPADSLPWMQVWDLNRIQEGRHGITEYKIRVLPGQSGDT